MFHHAKQADDAIKLSKDLLTHPHRSALMRRFDFQWEKAHKLLPQLCYRIHAVEPTDVLDAYDAVLEFIQAMTDWRMRHSPRPFLNPLAYAHFLAGVLALSWVDAANARNRGWYGVDMRDRLAPMLQASLDHITMAADLEPRFDSRDHKTSRSRYGRAVMACALAEATATTFCFKAYLPMDAAPFTRQDLTAAFARYKDEALELSHDNAGDGTDWLRICALGLERFEVLGCEHRTTLPEEVESVDVMGRDIKHRLLGGSRLRLFYLWSRMHKAYREIEELEYEKATLPTHNGAFIEIMPLLEQGTWVANHLINAERRHIEKEQAGGFDRCSLNTLNCGATTGLRLVVGMIFDAPLLQLDDLFRRAIYHGRGLTERGQPEACQEACEVALKLLYCTEIKEEHAVFYRINLVGFLARALNAQSNDKEDSASAARMLLESTDINTIRRLTLKDRWFYHHAAAGLLGGTHKNLAARGRNLVLAQDVPKSCDPVSDARMLLALLARETD